MSADYRQLAAISCEHFEARRLDAMSAWRERKKQIEGIGRRAGEAETEGKPFKIEDRERSLLFQPCGG